MVTVGSSLFAVTDYAMENTSSDHSSIPGTCVRACSVPGTI